MSVRAHARCSLAPLAAVLLAAGCGWGDGDLAGPSGTPPLQAYGDFRITVGPGTKPTFSWPGAGGEIGVSLSPNDPTYGAARHDNQWDLGPDFDVAPDGWRWVTSPVTYGTRQPGTAYVDQPNPRALVAGRRYLVVVARMDNRGAGQEFVP